MITRPSFAFLFLLSRFQLVLVHYRFSSLLIWRSDHCVNIRRMTKPQIVRVVGATRTDTRFDRTTLSYPPSTSFTNATFIIIFVSRKNTFELLLSTFFNHFNPLFSPPQFSSFLLSFFSIIISIINIFLIFFAQSHATQTDVQQVFATTTIQKAAENKCQSNVVFALPSSNCRQMILDLRFDHIVRIGGASFHTHSLLFNILHLSTSRTSLCRGNLNRRHLAFIFFMFDQVDHTTSHSYCPDRATLQPFSFWHFQLHSCECDVAVFRASFFDAESRKSAMTNSTSSIYATRIIICQSTFRLLFVSAPLFPSFCLRPGIRRTSNCACCCDTRFVSSPPSPSFQ